MKDYSDFYAKAFRQFVQNAMAEQHINPTTLSGATGLSRSYCAKLVNNDIPATQPTLSTVSVVCWALGTSPAKFLYALEQMIPTEDRGAFRVTSKTRPGGTVAASKTKPRIRVATPPAVSRDEVQSIISSVELT